MYICLIVFRDLDILYQIVVEFGFGFILLMFDCDVFVCKIEYLVVSFF